MRPHALAPVLRETVRLVDSRLPLLRFHLERLAEGGIPAEELSAVETAALAAARSAPPAARKLQVVVAPGGRLAVRVSAEASSLDVPGGPAIVPVTVRRLPVLPPHAAKPASRGYWDGPQHAAELRGGQQAVLVTPAGDVIDGGTASVWAVLGRTLVTPPAPPAVAGVARRVILRELAPALGLRTEVRHLTLAELLAADEVLLSNAVGGVVPARGKGGRTAEQLSVAFVELLQQNGNIW
jgi:branched-subunit amino acid aminotransferase/4-amino-4-deoxychorismate lyase